MSRHLIVRASCRWWVVLVGATLALWGQTSQTTAQIKGMIQSDDGKPVVNALVAAVAQKASVTRAFSSSGADGTFTLSGLSAGDFRICVQVPDSAFLNPCEWSANAPTTSISQGQSANIGTITLKKGQFLRVHLVDDSGVLATNRGKAGAHILLGVWSNDSLFHAMRLTAKTSAGQAHELTIPFDTPLQLSIQSRFYSLADEGGVTIDKSKGLAVPVQIPRGTTPGVVIFHVTGINN